MAPVEIETAPQQDTPPGPLELLAQKVVQAREWLTDRHLDCEVKVNEAKDAANRAVQVAEEARFEWEQANQAYQAAKAELQTALAVLDGE
jgi:hypothetical protein